VKRAALLVAAAALAVAAPGSEAGKKPRCAKTVKVVTGDDADGNLFFRKRRVTLKEGSCVRWVWTGTLDHQVEGKGFRSKLRAAPYSYRRRYAKARRRAFQVLCTQHSLSMRMRVKVVPR
jgi:plastocyanin